VTHTLGTPQVPGVIGGNQLVGKFYDFQAKVAQSMARGLDQPNATNRSNTTASEVSKTIDLSANFSFLANQLYKIRLVGRHCTDNDQWMQETEQWVLGGTTPVLIGSARLINAAGIIATTPVQYGNCHVQGTYSTDTVTAVAANSSAGSSLGNNSTNTIVLTHPICRAAPKYIKGINNCPAAATASGARHVAGVSASSTTFSLFVTDLATPSAASPAAAVLDVDFFIAPPPSILLVMNGSLLEVHVGHDASDEVQHDAEVYIDDPRDAPFFGS
jgi:hypothetical protein